MEEKDEQKFWSVGNASKVGDRKNENYYNPMAFDKEIIIEENVSILKNRMQ